MNTLTRRLLAPLPLIALVSAPVVAQKPIRAALIAATDREAAPPFQLADGSGKAVRLADFRGQPLVVNLWATTCGGCQAELPEFVRLDRNCRAKGLSIVGVSMDVMYEDLKSAADGWAHVKPFAAQRGLRYTIVLDDGSVEKAYKVTALPATYLIDRDGRIAAAYVGVVDAADLEANVNALLAERR